jgi:uracil-DNA glycosylase family 4
LRKTAILHHRPSSPDALATFDRACRSCPRLAALRDQVKQQYPDYYAAPVPAFGDAAARLLIVGLAPGMHGANRTGRPFTGDFAGILLYTTLFNNGFANVAKSVSAHDGLRLIDCRISNAVKCVPPENKPTPIEIKTCNRYLARELTALQPGAAVLALGQIAHQAVLLGSGLKRAAFAFAHGAVHTLPNGCTLFDSYHCSRYNTQTNRLTAEMFEAVFKTIRQYLGAPPSRKVSD